MRELKNQDEKQTANREDAGHQNGRHENAIHENAWVVFSGQTELPHLKLLRPGFRHCFLILKRGKHWVSLDPMSHVTEIGLHLLPDNFDLPNWLKDRGHTVVATSVQKAPKKALPPTLFTCVEAVKRVLGVHNWKVLTPWQLYKHLNTGLHHGAAA